MKQFETKAQERHYYETQASELEFLTWYAQQEKPNYPKPALTVDMIVLRWNDRVMPAQLQLLLVRRKAHLYLNCYALPGGFVNPNEDTTTATIREVAEETGIHLDPLRCEQLETIATPNRDPRDWVVSVAHIAYLPYDEQQVAVAGDDASEVCWVNIALDSQQQVRLTCTTSGKEITALAFDHATIIAKAMKRLSNKLDYNPTVLSLLPTKFTIKQVRAIFDVFNHPQFRHVGMTAFRLRQEKFLTFIEFAHVGQRGRSHKTYAYQLRHI